MDDVVLARHGESETGAAGVVGGDAPLTEVGRMQARELGARLSEMPIDVCLVSEARRARETAELAVVAHDVPIEVLPELNDIGFGSFEGRPLAEYRGWVAARPPTEAPPDGESRLETLRRFGRALRALCGRRERHLLVVGHGLLLRAVSDERPQPVVAGVPYGSSLYLTRTELERATRRLEAWCEAPSW